MVRDVAERDPSRAPPAQGRSENPKRECPRRPSRAAPFPRASSRRERQGRGLHGRTPPQVPEGRPPGLGPQLPVVDAKRSLYPSGRFGSLTTTVTTQFSQKISNATSTVFLRKGSCRPLSPA